MQDTFHSCMQDTFARATHSAGRPSAARDDRVSCIQLSLALRLNAAKPSARDDRVFCTQDNGKGLPLNWGYVFG